VVFACEVHDSGTHGKCYPWVTLSIQLILLGINRCETHENLRKPMIIP